MDGTTELAIAELIIYFFIVPFALYLLLKHGKHGIEGWLFFNAFCLLRIVAAILQIKNWHDVKHGKPSSDTASIVNSIGLSALLLCSCGLIHEASAYEYNHSRKRGWIIVILNHLAVTMGIALAATGGSKASTATSSHDRTKGKALIITGYFILLAADFFVIHYAAKTLAALKQSATRGRSSAPRKAQILAVGVVAALVTLLATIIYRIVYGFTLNPSLSPYTGSLAVKVVLIFLVQLIAALLVTVAGFMSMNVAKEGAVQDSELTNIVPDRK